MNRLNHSSFILVSALVAGACAGPPAGARLVKAGNGFGFRLLYSLLVREPQRNTFISPTSVALALGMAWNGAEGETREALARTLGYADMEPEDVNIAGAALLAALQSAGPEVELEVANSLWARKGIPLAREYIETCEDFYDARVAELDFGDPTSAEVINDWVRQKTRERITSIAPQLDIRDVLMLVNAVYFKGRWSREFDRELTLEQDFYLPSGKAKQVPMMRSRDEYRYYADKRFQLVSLPYGDGRFSMLVFLPARREPEEPTRDEKGNITNAHLAKAVWDLAERMTPETWQQWQGSMVTVEGEVVLPRFTLEYEQTLGPVLSDLGMEIAFDPARADFSGMLPAEIDMPFYLNEVLHKSFVEVNEEGTEAAAVTSIKKEPTAVPGEREAFTMVVDRPFLCAVVDHGSGAVLFLGAVFEPGS